jgi:hypothetical protein
VIALVRHRDIPVKHKEHRRPGRRLCRRPPPAETTAASLSPSNRRSSRGSKWPRFGIRTQELPPRLIGSLREFARSMSKPHRQPHSLLGRHVLAPSIPPGPEVGRITHAVYQLQLDDEVVDCRPGARRRGQDRRFDGLIPGWGD